MRLCVANIVPVPEDYLAASRQSVETICRRVLHADTELAFRAPRAGLTLGPDGLEYHRNAYYEFLIGGAVIDTILEADTEGFDAFVINCFDDPGLKQIRSLIETPVFGLSEPTFAWAATLGAKFGALVPDMPGQVSYVTRQIEQLGLGDRLIPNGVRAERRRFVQSFGEALSDPAPMIDRLSAQAREMIDEGADVVVLACGGLGQICGNAGFHMLEHRGARIPIVNPLTTAVKTAEMAVAMQNGLGYQIPSRVHAGTRLSAEDRVRFRDAFLG
ncbi:aspartate/glutamate racemase family protein [Flavisphingomonas formosensis]|uniref:aspartate/glutamate racemase family protein n=1 Tax=Flavisphingomonas formosensis TaxID=861534 RepID=UPI0012F8E835|nr:aspartate/glutamate racemase family protein [Sphingomonas formosensis]